ncbi:hypothetical protein GQ600_9663 [Phytophthora cactorum]|nr:hypothetical protein GQ600_9663 [Phytophthora cactorum]
MWCTHGSAHKSCGEDRRDCDLRYPGCEASFMVRCGKVTKLGFAEWEACVVPKTEVRRELGLLTEMKASTSDINRYLSKQLGGCQWLQ